MIPPSHSRIKNTKRWVGWLLLFALLGCSDPEKNGDPSPSPSTTVTPGTGKGIFVSSQSYNGNLRDVLETSTGLEAGDKACNDLATAAGLEGTWMAWLSDNNFDAIVRVEAAGASGPWALIEENLLVFANRSSLTETPLVPINRDETGTLVEAVLVWTGSHLGGTKATAHCDNWTDDTTDVGIHPVDGRVGSSAKSDSQWTDGTQNTCLDELRLYCLEL